MCVPGPTLLRGPAAAILEAFWFAAGFRVKIDPKYVCWITGNLDSTSALYILMSPVYTLKRINDRMENNIKVGNPKLNRCWIEK